VRQFRRNHPGLVQCTPDEAVDAVE
jgi:hypothetical protein